jgi:hypothetical protein
VPHCSKRLFARLQYSRILCCTMSFAAASSFYGQLIFPLSYAL